MKDIFKNLLVPFAKPVLSKIHQYKDIHRGESCYIFGNGISLKWFDLSNFADKTAIACGSIPFHNDFNKLNVKYMSLVEPWFFYPKLWTIHHPINIAQNIRKEAFNEIIKRYPEKDFFLNLSNYLAIRSKNITFLFRDIYDDRLPVDFITRRINAFHGALRTCILLSIYMGFNHCYLVGCDYTHVPSRSLHFFEKGQGIFIPQEKYNKDFFEIAKEYIDITTITLDGTSNFLDAITYKEYTGHNPLFKENVELVDDRYLNILATWSGYSIY